MTAKTSVIKKASSLPRSSSIPIFPTPQTPTNVTQPTPQTPTNVAKSTPLEPASISTAPPDPLKQILGGSIPPIFPPPKSPPMKMEEWCTCGAKVRHKPFKSKRCTRRPPSTRIVPDVPTCPSCQRNGWLWEHHPQSPLCPFLKHKNGFFRGLNFPSLTAPAPLGITPYFEGTHFFSSTYLCTYPLTFLDCSRAKPLHTSPSCTVLGLEQTFSRDRFPLRAQSRKHLIPLWLYRGIRNSC